MADVKKSENLSAAAMDQLTKATTGTVAAVKSVGSYVSDQAQSIAAAVNEGMPAARSYVGAQAENVTGVVSEGLKSAARSIRQNAPPEGQIGQAVSGVAQTFSNTAGYLDREGFNGMTRDLTATIKSNPVPALLFGFGLGFLLARAASSKS